MIIEQIVEQSIIDEIYSKKKLSSEEIIQLKPNEYIVLKSVTGSSAVLRYQTKDYYKLVEPKTKIGKTTANDLQQLCLMDSLLDDNIKIVSCIGPAGSGKSYLSLEYAVQAINASKELKLICTKPTVAIGNDKYFGSVPGTVQDKFDIFLDSFYLTLSKLIPSEVWLQTLIEKERIQFSPIQFVRGNHWENVLLVLDECQSLGWHELKSILSRLGDGSKAILLGDIKQKDKMANGFESLVNSRTYQESTLTSHIELEKDYRGPISRLISKIDEEIS